jgi:uncharacterized tellurite resistance protein B-like protein
LIHSKISDEKYDKLHEEFEHDNDYKSIQKIRSTIKRFNFSEAQLEELIKEIMELFLVDGEMDTLERNLLLGLNKVLRD